MFLLQGCLMKIISREFWGKNIAYLSIAAYSVAKMTMYRKLNLQSKIVKHRDVPELTYSGAPKIVRPKPEFFN